MRFGNACATAACRGATSGRNCSGCCAARASSLCATDVVSWMCRRPRTGSMRPFTISCCWIVRGCRRIGRHWTGQQQDGGRSILEPGHRQSWRAWRYGLEPRMPLAWKQTHAVSPWLQRERVSPACADGCTLSLGTRQRSPCRRTRSPRDLLVHEIIGCIESEESSPCRCRCQTAPAGSWRSSHPGWVHHLVCSGWSIRLAACQRPTWIVARASNFLDDFRWGILHSELSTRAPLGSGGRVRSPLTSTRTWNSCRSAVSTSG